MALVRQFRVSWVVVLRAGAVIEARVAVTGRTLGLAVVSGVARLALAEVRVSVGYAHSSVVADATRAVIDLNFAAGSRPPRLANTGVVVDFLDAFRCPGRRAGVGEALVDVPFAPSANVSWRAPALVSADQIDAHTAVVASAFVAVIMVDLTLQAAGSLRARALEVVDQVEAHSAVEAGVARAVVDVVLALHAVVAARAVALVPAAPEVAAGAAIVARVGVAVVDGVLAVGSLVALGAEALVTTSHVTATSAVLAKRGPRDAPV